jgi:quercetin dioxygenase-like cupin family protein
MTTITRLYTDDQGNARFEDVAMSFLPENPAPNVMGMSTAWPASGVLFGRGPAGGSHPEQPESRRQLIVGVSGSVEVTATGETRTFGPGDVLLAEDTSGVGHSSRSATGFVAAVILLEPPETP